METWWLIDEIVTHENASEEGIVTHEGDSEDKKSHERDHHEETKEEEASKVPEEDTNHVEENIMHEGEAQNETVLTLEDIDLHEVPLKLEADDARKETQGVHEETEGENREETVVTLDDITLEETNDAHKETQDVHEETESPDKATT